MKDWRRGRRRKTEMAEKQTESGDRHTLGGLACRCTPTLKSARQKKVGTHWNTPVNTHTNTERRGSQLWDQELNWVTWKVCMITIYFTTVIFDKIDSLSCTGLVRNVTFHQEYRKSLNTASVFKVSVQSICIQTQMAAQQLFCLPSWEFRVINLGRDASRGRDNSPWSI